AVQACGVCPTGPQSAGGEPPRQTLPVTPGHEIVGVIAALGPQVTRFRIGDRVGVPWLAFTCGECAYCRSGQENLCERARFTGYTRDGGYAEQALADARYCLALPPAGAAAELAPLLCAGLIGYRAYRAAGEGRNLGLYGFGAAAHLLAQVARAQGRRLWGERAVSSVANLTRADGQEFLALATRMGLTATVQPFALAEANLALERLRSGALEGAAVLEMPGH